MKYKKSHKWFLLLILIVFGSLGYFHSLFSKTKQNLPIVGVGYAIWNSGYQEANAIPSEKLASNNVDNKVFNSGVVIPMGLTLNYRVSQKFSVFIDGQIRTIPNDKLDNWVGGWKFDQLFVGSIGMQYHFNMAHYVGPKLVNRTKRNMDHMKVIYGYNY